MEENNSDRKWLDILIFLSKNNFEFMVVGGAAMSLHGIPRTTLDIDIYIESTHKSVETICQLLSEKNDLICKQESMRLMAHRAEFLEGQWMTFALPNGPDIIDVYFEKPDYYKLLRKDALQVEVSGFPVFVANIQQLIKMKMVCDRPIDKADVALLNEFSKIIEELD